MADVRRSARSFSPRARSSPTSSSRTIDNSFGSWFAFDEHGAEAPPPSDTKTSIAVWVGLYPTVVLLTLALSPLKMPLWLGLLVGNLLSSFAMSFLTMPYYVNPLLKRWLRPPPDVPEGQDELAGHRHRRRGAGVLGRGLLPGDQGVLAPALTAGQRRGCADARDHAEAWQPASAPTSSRPASGARRSNLRTS